MFCVLLWVWVGASGEFMRKPVSQWDNGDVLDWTVGLGDWARQANVTRLFQLQVLLYLIGHCVLCCVHEYNYYSWVRN